MDLMDAALLLVVLMTCWCAAAALEPTWRHEAERIWPRGADLPMAAVRCPRTPSAPAGGGGEIRTEMNPPTANGTDDDDDDDEEEKSCRWPTTLLLLLARCARCWWDVLQPRRKRHNRRRRPAEQLVLRVARGC